MNESMSDMTIASHASPFKLSDPTLTSSSDDVLLSMKDILPERIGNPTFDMDLRPPLMPYHSYPHDFNDFFREKPFLPSSDPIDLYPPSPSRDSSFKTTINEIDDSCKKKNRSPRRERTKSHTPRPSNSFILYRREKHSEIMKNYQGSKTLNNNFISKIVARWWKAEPEEVKAFWARKADEEKKAHMEKYPDYKYRPRKSASRNSGTSASKTDARMMPPSTTGLLNISPRAIIPSHHIQPMIMPSMHPNNGMHLDITGNYFCMFDGPMYPMHMQESYIPDTEAMDGFFDKRTGMWNGPKM